jgi:hypothetical protein
MVYRGDVRNQWWVYCEENVILDEECEYKLLWYLNME